MKRILITGGAGFIGSHLVDHLLAAGHAVTVIDNESTGARDNLAAAMTHSKFAYEPGDVADAARLVPLIQAADEIYHLAAVVGVQLVADAPVQTVTTNVRPTEILLEAAAAEQAAGRPKAVFLASSSEVYGKNPKSVWKEEDDLVWGPTTNPRWAYGASKAMDEFFALAYARECGLPVVIGRFFNVVGPRQVGTYGMVLPRFVEAALRNEPLVVYDDGKQVRCFAHVHDVIRAVVALMESPAAYGQVVNIGSDLPVSIVGLAEQVVAAAGSSSAIEFRPFREVFGADFEDIPHRVPDTGKLRELTGCELSSDLGDIIRDAIEDRRQQLGLVEET